MHTQKMIAIHISFLTSFSFFFFGILEYFGIFRRFQHTVAGIHLCCALQHHLAEPSHLATLSDLAHGHLHGPQQAGVEHKFPFVNRLSAQAYR